MNSSLFSAILLLVAPSLALAQTLPVNVFDGVSAAWDLAPAQSAPETVKGAPSLIAVVAELRTRKPLQAALESLRERHGFVLDLTVRPKPLGAEKQFAILPVPAPETPALAIVLGLVEAAKADALCADESVRCLKRGEALGRAGVREPAALVREKGAELAKLPGVLFVGVGPDCGETGEHNHIQAHGDAVVLVHKNGADARALREAALKAVPELDKAPLALVEQPAPVQQTRAPRRFAAPY